MKIRGQTYFLIAILAVTLLTVGLSLGMKPMSRLLPLLIGGVTLFLILIQLVVELRGARIEQGSKTTTTTGEAQCESAIVTDAVKRRGYLVAGMWIVGSVIAVYLLGFIIAIAVFIFIYMKKHRAGWLQSIIYSVLMDVAVYGIFQYWMQINLWRGIIPALISP